MPDFVKLITGHYTSHGKITTKYARRFIVYVTGNFKHFRFLEYMWREYHTPDARRLRDLAELGSSTEYFVDYRNFIYFKRFRELGYLGSDDLVHARDASYLSCLASLTFPRDVVETSREGLRVSERVEKIDHLTILLEWLIYRKGNWSPICYVLQELEKAEKDGGSRGKDGFYTRCTPDDLALIGDILDKEQDQQIRDACVDTLRDIAAYLSIYPVDEALRQELEKIIKRLQK